MKILVVLFSILIVSCNAHSDDILNNYHPEDQIMIDQNGKIKIIEDSQLEDKHIESQHKGRMCLTLTIDENDKMIYDVKKCEKDS